MQRVDLRRRSQALTKGRRTAAGCAQAERFLVAASLRKACQEARHHGVPCANGVHRLAPAGGLLPDAPGLHAAGRLKLGYARAARIVDEMEDKGIVGPFEGSKPRQLLITKEQWQAMQNGQPLEAPPAVEDEID